MTAPIVEQLTPQQSAALLALADELAKAGRANWTHPKRAAFADQLRALASPAPTDAGVLPPLPEPEGWTFQHDETGRMSTLENDGINNPENFAVNNPRLQLCAALYSEKQMHAYAREALAASAPDHFPDVGKMVPLPSDVEANVSNAAEPFLYTSATPRTCSDERPCINCFADQGECLGPYKKPDATPGQGADEPRRETEGGWRINRSTDSVQCWSDGRWENWGSVAEYESRNYYDNSGPAPQPTKPEADVQAERDFVELLGSDGKPNGYVQTFAKGAMFAHEEERLRTFIRQSQTSFPGWLLHDCRAAADAIATLRVALESQIKITNTERGHAERCAQKLAAQAGQGEALGDEVRNTLAGIAFANRRNKDVFDDDAAFVDWAQSIAKHVINKYAGHGEANPCTDSDGHAFPRSGSPCLYCEATPPPARSSDEAIPLAHDWLENTKPFPSVASREWQDGWDSCRSFVHDRNRARNRGTAEGAT